MQRQIIKGSVFYLYSGEGASLNYIGEKTYPGRKQVITKNDMKALKAEYPEVTSAIFHHYDQELRYMSDETFIENSTVVEEKEEN